MTGRRVPLEALPVVPANQGAYGDSAEATARLVAALLASGRPNVRAPEMLGCPAARRRYSSLRALSRASRSAGAP